MKMSRQTWIYLFICLVSPATAQDYINYNSDDSFSLNEHMSDWTGWTGGPKPKCIDIPANLTLCQNIGYTSMRLPNLLDHDLLSEVTQQARSWVPLLGIHCHPDAKLFLCSLFTPVCLERTIWPCRSLCESVKNACLVRMKFYKYDWPEMVRCNKFPVDNDLCIKQQTYNKPCNGTHCKNDGDSSGGYIADNNCTACKNPMTYEAIVDSYCRSEFVIRTGVTEVQQIMADSLLILKRKKKFYKKNAIISKKEKKNMAMVIKGGASCQCNIVNDTKSKFLMMGNRTGNDFVLTFVVPWEKKNKAFKKALKKIKKGPKCDELLPYEVIGIPTQIPTHAGAGTPKPTRTKGKGKGRKGRKKGRKGKKGKGKKGKRGKKGKNGRKKGKKGKKGRRKKDRKKKKKQSEVVTPAP